MIRAAIVGLGRWGQQLVASVQESSPAIRFAAAVTHTPANAQGFAARHGLALGSDLDAVLRDPAIDALVIASPNSRHLEQILAAARAGKHVLVDKPFALTRADAERAVAACRQAGVAVAAAHNRRFLPVYDELRRMVAAGELGTLLHLEAHFSSPGAFAYRPGMWRAERAENPGGGMAAMGIHMVDALIGLGGPIARVVARSTRRALAIDVDDTTSMLLDFASGATGYLATLATTTSQWRLQVAGARGWAEARDHTRLEVRLTGEPRRMIEFDPFDSVRAELEAFAAAIEGRAPYPISDAEVVNGIAVFEACARSAETGQAVAIPT